MKAPKIKCDCTTPAGGVVGALARLLFAVPAYAPDERKEDLLYVHICFKKRWQNGNWKRCCCVCGGKLNAKNKLYSDINKQMGQLR